MDHEMGLVGMDFLVTVEEEEEDEEDKLTVKWTGKTSSLWFGGYGLFGSMQGSFYLSGGRRERQREEGRERENKILLTTATMNFHIWKFNIAIVKKDATLQ
jgi:hypothetical protein